MCHAIDFGAGNLRGPLSMEYRGAARGKVPGYKYSTALREVGGEWSYENLNIFISDPSRAIPGTEMLLNPERIGQTRCSRMPSGPTSLLSCAAEAIVPCLCPEISFTGRSTPVTKLNAATISGIWRH